MKFIFFVSFAFLGLVSCVSFNTGSLETQRFDHNKNFKIIGSISGSSTANYFLGIGGGQSKGSYITAKENMYRNYILKENQNITNIVTERTTTYFILVGLFSSTTVSISADVIEFYDSTHSNSIIKKREDNVFDSRQNSSTSFPNPELDYKKIYSSLAAYENFNSVLIGDSVMVSAWIDGVYNIFPGKIIEKIGVRTVNVITYTSINNPYTLEVNYKWCRKVIKE